MTTSETGVNFDRFLEKYITIGNGVPYTHTTVGNPWKKYYIPDEASLEFHKLYFSAYKHKNLHIVEKPRELGPLVIDIDFKLSEKNRKYTEEDIKYIITKINKIVR